MKGLRKMRAEAVAKAQELTAQVKAGGELSDEDAAAVKDLLAQIDDLDAQIEAATEKADVVRKIATLGAGEETQPTGSQGDGEAPAKSVGAHFVKAMSGAGRSLRQEGTFQAPAFKAATDDHATGGYGALVTDIDRDPALPFQRPLVVADLFGSGSVTGNAITYPVFGALQGATGFVSEGGLKPQLHVADPTWVTDALGEVAGWFRVTDDMSEDLAYIASEINSTAIYNLQLNEELALLSGDGTTPNLRGILNRTGVQVADKGSDSVPDALFKASQSVQEASGFAADGIVINPADYSAVRLSKDSNGQYFGGGYFAGQYGNGGILQNPPLWGLRTVVTASIPAGTALVGAFAQGGKVFRKGGVRVESTNSHEDDFSHDRITIRVRERLGLQVKYPAAFSKVTLGTGAGA